MCPLGSEPGYIFVILLEKDFFCAQGEASLPCLYFKEALTAWDPQAWQVLFLRCSEAGRGDNYSAARKAAEEGSEQGASGPRDTGVILAEGGGTTQGRWLRAQPLPRMGCPGSRSERGWGQGSGTGMWAAGSGWRGGLRVEGETQRAAPDFGKVSPSLRELQKEYDKGILSQRLGCGVQAGRERDGRPLPPVA